MADLKKKKRVIHRSAVSPICFASFFLIFWRKKREKVGSIDFRPVQSMAVGLKKKFNVREKRK